jgi:DNA modification methylase
VADKKIEWPADKVERRPISDLIPYARNSRTHSDAQVAQIAASIREWGWTMPILIDETGSIIAGHGRVMAAQKLGIKHVPCMTATGWSEAKRRAYVIADNKLALNAGWDDEMLRAEFSELRDLDFDLSLTGFDEAEIGALFPTGVTEGLTDEDAVPEAPEQPVTVEGDVWLLGRHRLMCGDSTSIDAVDKLMGGRKADMVFTDPPYGVNMQRSGSIKGDASMDEAEGIIAGAISVASVVSKQGASWYFWVGFRAYAFTDTEVSKHRKVSNCIVWKKPSIGMGKGGYRFQHELCVFAGEVESRSVSDVWEFGRDTSALHPTMKPVDLVCYGLNNSSKSGDEVLDLFGGSGSTLIACEKTARDCRMMELDPKYCDVIIKRWQDFTGQQATLEATGQTYDELKAEREAA